MSIKGRIILIWHGHRLNEQHNPYNLEFVLQDDEIDDNLTGFINKPFTHLLDTNEEYEEHDAVDVIGTVIGIGDIVVVNLAVSNTPAVHNALFGTKLFVNRQLPELISFRKMYESREEYDANEHKIQLFALETKEVTLLSLCRQRSRNYHKMILRVVDESGSARLDTQDEYTTLANSTKYSKLLDLSLPWRLQLQSPSSVGDGSTSGQSSGSGKKRERGVVIIDLSDSEYDSNEEAEEPNAKKALVGDDEDPIDTKELVKVKIEQE
nr:replication protein A 70 kDa DNA-binding subunit B [Tanacetum cinerariifolium]